ncbi:MAG TPA: hypothetical protein VKY51_01870 [Fredinandcohnia sp.]|nr:hypothetical protein [Fredinandcohnia sp.]
MRNEACLSDLFLDRWRVGELSELEMARGEAHVRQCLVCARRKRELDRQALEFDVQLRLPRRAPRRAWRTALGLLAAAAAASFAVVLVPAALPSPTDAPGVRTKGGPSFSVIARRADGTIHPVLPGDVLAPGDAIRFEVRTEEPRIVAVLGIDAAGVVTPYVDEVAIEAEGPQLLPGAIRLDETLGPERIVALFCDEPLGRTRLLAIGAEALRQARGDPSRELRLDAPGCAQSSILIRKEATP